MKKFPLSTLCALALSAILSAFSCSPDYVVFFDKNNHDAGSTEASPSFKKLEPHAMSVGTLPAEPTRPGYTFVGGKTTGAWCKAVIPQATLTAPTLPMAVVW